MNARALALSLLVAFLPAHAAAESEGHSGARPGMQYTEGVLCTNANVAKDLIDVIHDGAVYRDWLIGYSLSGHCVVWLDEFRLAHRLHPGKETFDGRRAELWAVVAPDGEEGVARYGIVFPATVGAVAGMNF